MRVGAVHDGRPRPRRLKGGGKMLRCLEEMEGLEGGGRGWENDGRTIVGMAHF